MIIATGSYGLTVDQLGQNLALKPVEGGLAELLDGYGIRIEKSLVMDPQNEPFPVQIDRPVGNSVVREMQAVNYPFFVDVRPDGMDKASPIVGKLAANHPELGVTDYGGRREKPGPPGIGAAQVERANAWLRSSPDIQPNLKQYPNVGFAVEGDRGSRPLAVAVRGAFESAFKGKPVPAAASQPAGLGSTGRRGHTDPRAADQQRHRVFARQRPPGGGRQQRFLDRHRLRDFGQHVRRPLPEQPPTLQNAVDWSVEDLDLLGIRARGTSARVLKPMAPGDQTVWEVLNYGIALIALIVIGVVWVVRRRNERPMVLDEKK